MKRLQRYFLVGLFSIFLFACQDDGEDTLIKGRRFIVVSVGDSESVVSLYEYSGNDLCVKTIDSRAMRIEGEERVFKDIKYRNNFIYTLTGRERKITQINIEDNFSSKTIGTPLLEYGICIAALEDGVAYIAEKYDSNSSRGYPVVKLYDAKLAFERDILLDTAINYVFDAYAVGDFLFLNVSIQSDTSRVDIIDLKSNKVVRKIDLGEEKVGGKFSFSDGRLWISDGYSINPSTFALTEYQFHATNYFGSNYVPPSPLLATHGDKVYCFQEPPWLVLPYLSEYNISTQEIKRIGDYDYFRPPIVYQSNCDVLISKGNTNDLLVYQTDGTIIQRMLLPYSEVRAIFFLD